jgi:hypothetical protein
MLSNNVFALISVPGVAPAGWTTELSWLDVAGVSKAINEKRNYLDKKIIFVSDSNTTQPLEFVIDPKTKDSLVWLCQVNIELHYLRVHQLGQPCTPCNNLFATCFKHTYRYLEVSPNILLPWPISTPEPLSQWSLMVASRLPLLRFSGLRRLRAKMSASSPQRELGKNLSYQFAKPRSPFRFVLFVVHRMQLWCVRCIYYIFLLIFFFLQINLAYMIYW